MLSFWSIFKSLRSFVSFFGPLPLLDLRIGNARVFKRKCLGRKTGLSTEGIAVGKERTWGSIIFGKISEKGFENVAAFGIFGLLLPHCGGGSALRREEQLFDREERERVSKYSNLKSLEVCLAARISRLLVWELGQLATFLFTGKRLHDFIMDFLLIYNFFQLHTSIIPLLTA